jgi:2-polyprenyl-6-methoxyphenol hydroxylase-like FAD-dependent oxidoreductase
MNVGAVRVDDLPVIDTDVLVVGAGPTGLMAGVVLSRRGLPAVVVDRKAGPTRESRALAVQARTMEIYDQLGLAETVLAGAFPAMRVRIGEAASSEGPDFSLLQKGATRFPGIQIFEQSRNEQLLADTLNAAQGDIRWQHRLVDLIDKDSPTGWPGGGVDRGRGRQPAPGAGTVVHWGGWCCVGSATGAESAVRR